MTSTTITATTPPPEGCVDTQVIDDHILLIGLNRPAKRNGWTPRMFRELAEAYTRLDDDPNLRVGVLHAFGDHFTAGLDLPAVAEYLKRGEKLTPTGLVEPHDYGMPGYRRRQKPMIAAVKGICFTVGIELMLGADIAVAADDCRFSQMEVQRCILPAGGATLRMPERAGVGNAMLHLLTADEFDASEAYRCNFVQKVVPAAELLDTALGLARRIAAQAPAAVVATRLNVLKAIELGQAAAVADFIPVQQRLASSEDAAEGVRSFIEKRPARFTGR
jgi:enoyl-CoA hydratase/carnithine racemase